MALTERRLVSWLGALFQTTAPGVLLGIGDDAAVLQPAAEPLIASVDSSVCGVHFDPAFVGYEDIGYRAFQAAISDLAAMGAAPVAALSSLILPRALGREDIEALTRGQARASTECTCPIVGGNIARGSELSLTTSVLGRAAQPLERRGARPGEELWLLGSLGLAAAGLSLLRLRRPDDERHPGLVRCIAAWRRPRALLAEGQGLVGRASAAIDVSDGLSSDAAQLAAASRVRVVVELERLRASLDPALFAAGQRLRRSPVRLALVGGEDYALLATGPRQRRPPGARAIGFVTRGAGAFLATGGRLMPLRGGFDHLRR